MTAHKKFVARSQPAPPAKAANAAKARAAGRLPRQRLAALATFATRAAENANSFGWCGSLEHGPHDSRAPPWIFAVQAQGPSKTTTEPNLISIGDYT